MPLAVTTCPVVETSLHIAGHFPCRNEGYRLAFAGWPYIVRLLMASA